VIFSPPFAKAFFAGKLITEEVIKQPNWRLDKLWLV
jgi:hypothetical protein